MKIIKYQKVGKDKYKIIFDNGEILVVLEEVIIKNELLLQKEIKEELYNKIIKDNLTATIYNDCLKLISTRLRSKSEIESYLNKKQVDENLKKQVINKLITRRYINDEVYAKCFIADKINLTNHGPYKIEKELEKQNIDHNLVLKYLYTAENNQLFKEKIAKIITKLIKTNKKYSGNLLRQKIYYYLINIGYETGMINEEINNYNFTNTNIKSEYQKIRNKYNKRYDEQKLQYIVKEKLLAKGYTIDEINNINIE